MAGAALTAFNAELAREALARAKAPESSDKRNGAEEGDDGSRCQGSPSKRQRSGQLRPSQSAEELLLWQQFQDFCEAEMASGRLPGDSLLLKTQELFQGIKGLAAKDRKPRDGDNMDTDVGAGAGNTFFEEHAIHTPTGNDARRAAEVLGSFQEIPVPAVPTVVPQERP